MKVLKIVAEGFVTSFRYPNFMWNKQPTFEMPPPSTIYGHICSAIGEWVDPNGLMFAYHFQYVSKFEDLEYIWTWDNKAKRETIKPFKRELLFQPRMVLYINRPNWLPHFRHPHYTVVLGRSQDLFTYTDVSLIDIEKADKAYFEHTLLPYSITQHTIRGYSVTMPRFLDYYNRRFPDSMQYFVIQERVHTNQDFLWFGEKPDGVTYWIDPESAESRNCHLGLSWLSFTGEQSESYHLA